MKRPRRIARSLAEIEPVLPAIKALLEKAYGKKLAEIILYGSFAKNRADQDSDIDIAVVLKDRVDQSKEIDRACDALYDLMLETGELISVFPVSKQEMARSNWPLYRHIAEQGKKL